ncbi:hypothetical protein GGTG_01741 [Gaeumannomyces tritici R3-111a-1]|uniref:Uncharacterized protein n=1 Tax=Gaeumannomyces tritici (strain R3-111a-1) TaxID=644352 RepID=J3NKF2_GAET3|nr:hypothetical protein GGTG_01741 [Gaeumannomyces tritici R3-111a-1]EJT81766.1 hypothetical protein GGTG_01741 [Gaeumannomyces tritici R3-111a-1]
MVALSCSKDGAPSKLWRRRRGVGGASPRGEGKKKHTKPGRAVVETCKQHAAPPHKGVQSLPIVARLEQHFAVPSERLNGSCSTRTMHWAGLHCVCAVQGAYVLGALPPATGTCTGPGTGTGTGRTLRIDALAICSWMVPPSPSRPVSPQSWLPLDLWHGRCSTHTPTGRERPTQTAYSSPPRQPPRTDGMSIQQGARRPTFPGGETTVREHGAGTAPRQKGDGEAALLQAWPRPLCSPCRCSLAPSFPHFGCLAVAVVFLFCFSFRLVVNAHGPPPFPPPSCSSLRYFGRMGQAWVKHDDLFFQQVF